jgi:hypothetical protein
VKPAEGERRDHDGSAQGQSAFRAGLSGGGLAPLVIATPGTTHIWRNPEQPERFSNSR